MSCVAAARRDSVCLTRHAALLTGAAAAVLLAVAATPSTARARSADEGCATIVGTVCEAPAVAPISFVGVMAPGDETIVNNDTLVVTADRDFGTGQDLFTNKGVVQLAKAAAPLNLSFLGLERFANEGGLVDLRNERAGDILTFSGAYAASGDARLALDIGPDGVDSLIVQGIASGKTTILLQADAEDATLLEESLRVVTVGPGSNAGAFRLAETDIGLVRYDLTFDKKTSSYMVEASAGRAVHQSVRAGEGLGFAWRASADAFNAEQAMARAAGGERGRVWAQVHASLIDRGSNLAGLEYEQGLLGGQMGVSLGARPLFGGHAAFGLTGGYVNSTLEFGKTGQTVDMRTVNGGAYGAWRAENLFATGLVKIDQHELTVEDRVAGFESDINGLSWGVQLQAGYRFTFGHVAFEPIVGLDYLSSSLDDLEVLRQTVTFEDREGLSVRVGGQALVRRIMANGRSVVWSAGLEAVRDLDTEYGGTLHSNGQTDTVLLEGPGAYGQARVGVQADAGGGLETYVQGEARFGDGPGGGGVRAGVRYRF